MLTRIQSTSIERPFVLASICHSHSYSYSHAHSVVLLRLQISAILRIVMLFSTMISILPKCNFFRRLPISCHLSFTFVMMTSNDIFLFTSFFMLCFDLLHSPSHTYRSHINGMHAHAMEFLRFHFQSQKSKIHCPVYTVSVHMFAKHIRTTKLFSLTSCSCSYKHSI